ncbi:hypothetical protein LUZ60_011416 [Juncus effusus]|nr:hypothetical protein LUZ60_011416 [Juncus effusus]
MDEREEDIEEMSDYYQTPNGKKKYSSRRASWTDPQRAYLIELLHLYNNPSHRGNIGWNRTAWIEMTKRFNTKFPLAYYDKKQLKEQEQTLKKAYKAIKGLIDNKGFEWDQNTKKVIAPNVDNLEDLLERNPVAKEWYNRTYLYYGDLAPLYDGFLGEITHKRKKIQVTTPQKRRRNVDGSPKSLVEPSRNSSRGLEQEEFIHTENEPLLDESNTQEPNFTQNITSIQMPEFPQVQNVTELPVRQKEASSQNRRKRRYNKARCNDEYLEYKKDETDKYLELMKRQDEVARKRLELEDKRFELELENVKMYSFKNAMDLFDSLEGFSFEEYNKVTDLFMRDEKVRDAFIDVKEEYKAPWIRLRIDHV